MIDWFLDVWDDYVSGLVAEVVLAAVIAYPTAIALRGMDVNADTLAVAIIIMALRYCSGASAS